MFLLRAADLPRLHDADLGRDAMPRVRARTDAGEEAAARRRPQAPVVTQTLIALNVIVFLVETATGAPLGGGGGGTVWNHGALFGPALTGSNPYPIYTGTHEYWRLLTSGFLHDGLLHIAFNMFFLYMMGPMLEPMIGRLNFAVVYFVSLLSGSFGALLFTPIAPTIGASTACFGVLGALMVVVALPRASRSGRAGSG